MRMSKHALNRMMQRSKDLQDYSVREILARASVVIPTRKASGFLCYFLSDLNINLIVNPESGLVVTSYRS